MIEKVVAPSEKLGPAFKVKVDAPLAPKKEARSS
jgi:hypothetical protein